MSKAGHLHLCGDTSNTDSFLLKFLLHVQQLQGFGKEVLIFSARYNQKLCIVYNLHAIYPLDSLRRGRLSKPALGRRVQFDLICPDSARFAQSAGNRFLI
jgi:hypothetical protein